MNTDYYKLIHAASKSQHPRFIVTEYGGGASDRASRSTTLDGALRAALLRVAQGQYTTARIYDCRFGSAQLALTVRTSPGGLSVRWETVLQWGHRDADKRSSAA